MIDFKITNLDSGDEIAIQQTAGVLAAAFPRHPAWSHMETALQEVVRALTPPGFCRVAQSKNGTILGWIGAAPIYGHPFAFYRKLGFVLAGVLPDANGRGKPDIFMAKRL